MQLSALRGLIVLQPPLPRPRAPFDAHRCASQSASGPLDLCHSLVRRPLVDRCSKHSEEEGQGVLGRVEKGGGGASKSKRSHTPALPLPGRVGHCWGYVPLWGAAWGSGPLLGRVGHLWGEWASAGA